MNETKHTPGEWNVSGDGDHVWVEPADKDANVICDMVGRLYDRDAGTTQLTDEDIANANLIAAAPDLLKAIEALMEPYEGKEADEFFYPTAVRIHNARKAIAKAKGESK